MDFVGQAGSLGKISIVGQAGSEAQPYWLGTSGLGNRVSTALAGSN